MIQNIRTWKDATGQWTKLHGCDTLFFGNSNLVLQLTSMATPRRNSNWLTSLGSCWSRKLCCTAEPSYKCICSSSPHFASWLLEKLFLEEKYISMFIQKGSISIIFSNTLLWLYPTILPSCGTSVSLHSRLRALGSSTILTFPFVSALLNPAPKVDGASFHQPLVTL